MSWRCFGSESLLLKLGLL
jgi:hypothetical protein